MTDDAADGIEFMRKRCQSRSPESGTQCDLPADHPHEAGHEARIKETRTYTGNVVWSAADIREGNTR